MFERSFLADECTEWRANEYFRKVWHIIERMRVEYIARFSQQDMFTNKDNDVLYKGEEQQVYFVFYSQFWSTNLFNNNTREHINFQSYKESYEARSGDWTLNNYLKQSIGFENS